MKKENLQWHPAFVAALRITFQEEIEELQILEEYSLSKSPPRIDALILKKNPQVKLKKKIGQIFRGYNIIEYKSPEDSLNINDFYKVYGYTCFYQSNTEKVREMKIKDQGSGIYYLTGDPFPIQFLYIPKLSKQENYWIQTLRNDLKAGNEIRGLMEKYEKNRKSKDCAAVMNLVTRANWEQMEVEKKMCEALNELFAEELKEADLKGRNDGKMEKLKELVQKKIAKNQTIEQIADALEESEESIEKIIEELKQEEITNS